MINPQNERHSEIGASSAYRWMACPGSVRLSHLIRMVVKATPSIYASKGTAAHTLCERCLLDGSDPHDHIGTSITADGLIFIVDEGMADSVGVYVSIVREELRSSQGFLSVEKEFDLGWLHPGMFGRNDASIMPSGVLGVLNVYDYKNGSKVVSAENNVQGMYYALGALGCNNQGMVDFVRITIVQPNAPGKDAVQSWSVSVSDLYKWAYDVLLPAALETQKPDAPCIPGEWCGFCPASGICEAKAKQAIALLDTAVPVKSESLSKQGTLLPEVGVLSPDQVSRLAVFFGSKDFDAWVKALVAEEFNLISSGVSIPGRKLAEKKSLGDRAWINEADTAAKLKVPLGESIYQSRLKSPAQMEKALVDIGYKKKAAQQELAPLVQRSEITSTVVVDDNDDNENVNNKKHRALKLLD